MNADPQQGHWEQVATLLRECLAAATVPLLAWVGWMFRRYRKDRGMLKKLEEERAKFQEHFGVDLIEHSKDVDDQLEEHDRELVRCRRIHDGIGDGVSGMQLIEKLAKRIELHEMECRQNRIEDAKFQTAIATDLTWIRRKMDC